MYEFKLPDLGEGIHEGELLKWYVQVGDMINEDEDLMDVETDKAAVTIPSPRTGKVAQLNGNVGDTLHVGSVVIVIDDGSGGEIAPPAPEVTQSAEKHQQIETTPIIVPSLQKKAKVEAPATQHTRPPGRPVPAAPATRKLARELGVDINLIAGTGPGGRVLRTDVTAFSEGELPVAAVSSESEIHKSAPDTKQSVMTGIPYLEIEAMPDFELYGKVERESVRSIRKKVARKMTTSMILVPHVAHMDEADVTELEAFRRKERKRREGLSGAKLTLLPFVIKALTGLLKRYPMFNSSLDPHREELVYKKYYNVGFAADTERGLVVPVVKNADQKSIISISDEIVDLATKARDGKIEANDMRGGTITITNVGPIGGTGLIPTINYPEVAILGMGQVREKPVVRDGEIVIRKMLPITLAFDHRVADGAQAAHMATDLIRLLSNPNQLMLES